MAEQTLLEFKEPVKSVWVHRTCRMCGKTFQAKRHRLKTRALNLCSFECYNKIRAKRVAEQVAKRYAPLPPAKSGGIVQVPLTRGLTAIISSEDAPLISQYKWCGLIMKHPRKQVKYYAYAWMGRKMVSMQNVLLNPPQGMLVDHIDGDGLNNTRSNLRLATVLQNRFNCRYRRGKSGFIGVVKYINRWGAFISNKNRREYIGYFGTPEEAARAYDRRCVELRGEFAVTNFPIEEYLAPNQVSV